MLTYHDIGNSLHVLGCLSAACDWSTGTHVSQLSQSKCRSRQLRLLRQSVHKYLHCLNNKCCETTLCFQLGEGANRTFAAEYCAILSDIACLSDYNTMLGLLPVFTPGRSRSAFCLGPLAPIQSRVLSRPRRWGPGTIFV